MSESRMMTIAQFAAAAGVSVQTIYRLLNSVKQETGECLTEKIGGKAHITERGEVVLRERLTRVQHDVKQAFNTVKQPESDEIIFLREQNQLLQGELITERAHSREQADKLADLAAQLAELSRNNQLLLGAEQSRTNPALLPGGEAGRSEGFFSRLFSRKS